MSDPILACLNGRFLPLSEAKVSVMDRGFLFGEGVYEVVRIYQGKPFHLKDHLDRLQGNIRALSLPHQIPTIQKHAEELLLRSKTSEATLYIQLTRGAFPNRRHAFSGHVEGGQATELLFLSPYDDPTEMRKTGAKAITYPDIRWKRVDLKTVNLLGNVFAAEAAREKGVYEAIYFNEQDEVTEGSHTNVFAVIKGRLLTFPLMKGVLPGVTRKILFELAQTMKLNLEERPFHLEEMYAAEEVFVSATTAEVMPILEIDEKQIGDGKVGKITSKLQLAYSKRVADFLLLA